MMRWTARTRIQVALAAGCLALAGAAAPAIAGSAQAVTIVSNVTFNPNGPNYGDFTATGPAVDAGVICASGTFVDTGIKFAGFQSRTGHVQLLVTKAFTCDGGAGSFSVKLQINADFDTGIESFAWAASDGLHGAGTGSTVPTDTGNINTYVGMVTD